MEIERLADDDLDRLRPLWLALHAHHRAVAPELAPYVDDDTSWRWRRAFYEHALASGGFAVVVRSQDRDIGYALVAPEPHHWYATFVTDSPMLAELQTLVILPDARGRGLGGRLFDAVEAELGARTAVDRVIGVLPQNARATAFYEERGYEPTWLTLTRFGRPPGDPGSRGGPVERLPADAIDGLRPLWLELHRHHQAVAPQLAPYLDDEASWTQVRPLIATAADDGLAWIATDGRRPVGFATASITVDDPLWADTWQVGRAVGETTLLSVDASARERGVGSALLDVVDREFAARGALDQVIGVIAGNDRARALYERRGFRPAWCALTRFAARTRRRAAPL